MTSYQPPPPSAYRLPSIARRLVGGVLVAIGYLLFFVGIPYAVLRILEQFGQPFPYAISVLAGIGIGLAALAVVRHLAGPTRWLGPTSMAYSSALLAYLLWLAAASSVTVSLGGATVTLDYGRLLLLLAISPLLAIVAGVFTTIEDAWRPAERYPFDYPP